MKKMVAVIEDEKDIRELVTLHLDKAGYRVKEYEEGSIFLKDLEKEVPDLLVLDLMLPDIDGIEICKKVRQNSNSQSLPIIMLTAKSDESDKIIGLELGADDYMTKPFSPKELLARVKAILRRKTETPASGIIQVGNSLVIDPDKVEVKVKGRQIELTQTEFKILLLLSSRIGRVYSREAILDYLWGHDKIVIDRTVDVHIKHLREKLGKIGSFVKNVRGMGYKIEP